MLAIQDTAYTRTLADLPHMLPRPAAIVAVSVHWQTRGAERVTATARPETVHDLGGFDAALYQVTYPVPGAPELAWEIVAFLARAGFEAAPDASRGLDHGTWVPLRWSFPEATVPVVQISLPVPVAPGRVPARHPLPAQHLAGATMNAPTVPRDEEGPRGAPGGRPLPYRRHPRAERWRCTTMHVAASCLTAPSPWRRLTALTVAAACLLSAGQATAQAPPANLTDAAGGGTGESATFHPGFGKRLLNDLGDLLSKPAHMDSSDWTHLGLASLAIGATATLDPRVRTWAQDHRSTSSDNFAKSIRPLGGWGAFATLGATWLAGKGWSQPSLVSTAEDGLEASIIAAGLITPAVKEVVGRARPSYGKGHASFSPFSGRASFPSGDATLVFSVASVVAAHAASLWLKGTAWGLAGLVGWERIHLDQHWASDVVAGALIGSAVGEWVVRHHEPGLRTHVGWVVGPAVGPGALGLEVARSW